MLLLDNRRELAAKHVQQLEKRRIEIAAKIQTVHAALTELSGKAPSNNVTADLCNLRGRKQLTLGAVRYWLNVTGKGASHLTDEALLTGIVLPPEVKQLITALTRINGSSEDPARYYKDGMFSPLPVTPAEKEMIYKRAEIAARSKEDIEMFNFIRLRCMIANKYNSKSGKWTMITEGELMGANNRHYAAFMRFDGVDQLFKVNREMFGTTSAFTPAFDEGTVSID